MNFGVHAKKAKVSQRTQRKGFRYYYKILIDIKQGFIFMVGRKIIQFYRRIYGKSNT